MGIMDGINAAMNSVTQRKIKLQKNITIQELNDLLTPHAGEFPVEFKMSSFPVKRITFKRHKQLEMSLIITAKDDIVKITPNIQEASVGVGNISIRTADMKNGFGFQTEYGREGYVNAVEQKLTEILRNAGY